MNRKPAKYIIVSLCWIIILVGCKQSGEKSKPNFVIILVDDLGKEWIGAYGAGDIKTPEIDRLSETGIRFTNAYSMPQCTPSRVALLTGQYPYNNGWINHYDVPRWGHGARFDPDKYPVFARSLRNAGYKTCATGKWQINDFRLEPEAMVNGGFDEYFMWTGGEGGNEEISNKRYWDPYIHSKDGSQTYEGQFGPDLFSDFAIDFMSENRDNPFLVYYPMVLTHTPFVATPLEPNAESKIEKHKAMVRYTDFIVGKIMKALNDLQIRDNTYVIFTTDNGTTPAIAGRKDGEFIIGGKSYLTENGINAPFIMNNPGVIKEGQVSDALVDFTDLFPTLMELSGTKELEDKYSIDGKSFASVVNGQQEVTENKKWVLSMGSHPASIDKRGRIRNHFTFRDRIMRNERYKIYIDTLRRIQRMYDLSTDPYETKDIANSDIETVENIRNQVQEILSFIPEADEHPDYEQLDRSLYDIPRDKLNAMSHKGSKRKNQLGPVISEDKYFQLNNK
ncbi:sulfatase-like hydrolase/transferase [Membranihabitans maritimus]|uniref:sulfatase-like hydrolase/transferase n=1 Tax=Membranihabitans maritimus TaxID=2904244 RepID=UPI001F004773|nr:sulfatase-like hydrolase/transferase [Membranihabitans maritimus]